jgi:SAM-dependent methyltransferase
MITLRVEQTHCEFCQMSTEERVLADRLIKWLPENKTFDGRLKIVECKVCGLRYLNPKPHIDDLSKIYSYDVYQDSTNNNRLLQTFLWQLSKEHCRSLQRVLEVGCGTGEFLAYLENKGIDSYGVEFADSARRVIFKGPLYVGRIEDIDIIDTQFDVVFVLNVIEHLLAPSVALAKIKGFLRDDGLLILRHPNSALFFNPVYKLLLEFPKFLLHRLLNALGGHTRFTIVGFQNQHLFYFHRRSISMMIERAGFTIEKFTTADPYNWRRLTQSLKALKLAEASIALLRYLTGFFGLGPECIIVARKVG